jgi:hypothetical protein
MNRSNLLAAYLLCLAAAHAASPKTPKFFARRDYPGLVASWIQVADTNGDGIPDLVVSGTSIEVELGNGGGGFSAGPTSKLVGGAPAQFFLRDLNGDGKVDIVYLGGDSTGDGIGVSLGNGDGTFQSGALYYIPDTGLRFLVVGDFNGDGILDAAASGTSGVWLLTGQGGGAFNTPVLIASLPTLDSPIAAADFNKDGNLDIVVGQDGGGENASGAGFAVLLGNGNGTFQQPQVFAAPRVVAWLTTGVLTTGGYPTIVVSTGASADVFLYTGDGAGGFSGPSYADLPGACCLPGESGFAIGDVNGDGIPDLVSTAGYIALGKGNGKFNAPYQYTINDEQEPRNVVLADLRNQGLSDIVFSGYFAVSVLLSEGKGAYEDGIKTTVTGGASCGAEADFNGDGKPDLAVVTSTGVSILLGTGKATSPFISGSTIAITGAACVQTGDLNGDGIPDLLVAVNGSPNSLVSYLGNGDGTFTLKSTSSTPNSGGAVVLADFNHDGKLDFATSGNLLGLGNGDGTFQAPTAIVASPPASGFSGIAAGDINNDGWPDLVMTNNAVPYNNLFVLLNNQQGGFTHVPTTFGPLSYQPILADLNGDGKLDLVLTYAAGHLNGNPEGVSVYLGNGAGGFTFQANLDNPSGLTGPTLVADVNGDGIPDICTLEADSLEIFLGTGNARYATPFDIGTGPAPSTILVENLHGQPASAGLPDIVAPDNSGEVVVLLNLTKQ